jgi:hypothetical protein
MRENKLGRLRLRRLMFRITGVFAEFAAGEPGAEELFVVGRLRNGVVAPTIRPEPTWHARRSGIGDGLGECWSSQTRETTVTVTERSVCVL